MVTLSKSKRPGRGGPVGRLRTLFPPLLSWRRSSHSLSDSHSLPRLHTYPPAPPLDSTAMVRNLGQSVWAPIPTFFQPETEDLGELASPLPGHVPSLS